ncbi:MAG: choice-of-anchor Q domain-containing protein [Pseudomonadota bacterium]
MLRKRHGVAAAILTLALSPALALAQPVAFFTDLTSGPNTGSGDYADGAFVRIYGSGFGATRGGGRVTLNGSEVASYAFWGTDPISGLSMIVVQPGSGTSSGDFVVTTNNGESSNGIRYTIDNSRNIREVNNNSSLQSAASSISGNNRRDIVYFRGGTYSTRVGRTSWGDDDFTFGSAFSNTAWIAYPGETVNVGDWRFYDGAGNADDVTVAGMYAVGGSDVFFSGWGGTAGSSNEPGPVNNRIIGNDITTTYTHNTQTGAVQTTGDGFRMLGNFVHDNGGNTIHNNNHSVYIQLGADDVEVAWNRFYNERLGHVIQVHTDGPMRQYDNVRIHSNVLQQGPNGSCRGINVSGSTASSTVDVYNNVFDSVGQNFSVHISYTGTTRFFNNTIVRGNGSDSFDGLVRLRGGEGSLTVYNNIFWDDGNSSNYVSAESGASMGSDLIVDSNLYFNRGNGPSSDSNAVSGNPELVNPSDSVWSRRDYRPLPTSPAVDAGSGSVGSLVSRDQAGSARPRGNGYDLGAYESDGTIAARPSPPRDLVAQ